jgi:hypothetical protein
MHHYVHCQACLIGGLDLHHVRAAWIRGRCLTLVHLSRCSLAACILHLDPSLAPSCWSANIDVQADLVPT